MTSKFQNESRGVRAAGRWTRGEPSGRTIVKRERARERDLERERERLEREGGERAIERERERERES